MQIIEPEKKTPFVTKEQEQDGNIPEWIHEIEEKTHHNQAKNKFSFYYLLIPLIILIAGAGVVFGFKKEIIKTPLFFAKKDSLSNIILSNYNQINSFSFDGEIKLRQENLGITAKTKGQWQKTNTTPEKNNIATKIDIFDNTNNSLLSGDIAFVDKELFLKLQNADEFSLFMINMATKSNIKTDNSWYKIDYSSVDIKEITGAKVPENISKKRPEIIVFTEEEREVLEFIQSKSKKLGQTNLPNNTKTAETIEIKLTKEDSDYLEKLIDPNKTESIPDDKNYTIKLWLDKNYFIEGLQFVAINSLTGVIDFDLWFVFSDLNKTFEIIKPENIKEQGKSDIPSIEETVRMFENGEITEEEFANHLSKIFGMNPPTEEEKMLAENQEIKAIISGLRSMAEIYSDKKSGYPEVNYSGVVKELGKKLKEEKPDIDTQKIIARDNKDSYLFSYPLLNEGSGNMEYWCIDSTGDIDFVEKAPINQETCR